MTDSTLLIYIPTYNRYERLCEQLDLIIPHLNTYPVDIIISNNASTDDRYKDLKEKYLNEKITFIDNPTNLGANPNIFNGFLYALIYDYVWILSDDDTITPTAIPSIMRRLDGQLDLIYIKLRTTSEHTELYSINDLLDNLKYGLGLISCAVIRTSAIKSSVKVGYEYISSGFPHLAILFNACINNKHLSVLEYPYTLILKTKAMDPPAESKHTYAQSIYGYITLADFIKNDKRRFDFIHEYLTKDFNLWSVVEFKQKYPERYKNMKGYILIRSPFLFCEFMIGCFLMSLLMFIWDNVSLHNRKRLKAIIYPCDYTKI